MEPKRSILHENHRKLGAKFAEFGGWEMPLEYPSGTLKEHQAVRTSVGIFDVSHLGKVEITGAGTAEFLNKCFTNDLAKISDGQAQYTICCDPETGGAVDDLLVYRFNSEHFLIMPNAANSAEVIKRIQAAAPAAVEIVDLHEERAVIAVQGTKSDEVLKKLQLPVGHNYMHFAVADFAGQQLVVCRTGYTGERGYELIVPNQIANQIWEELVTAGKEFNLLPCGLGARDTLRTEMGYPLHGQDLSMQISPVRANLGWAIAWDKAEFWGKTKLLDEKTGLQTTQLLGLVAKERGIPRPKMRVMITHDMAVGEITSGTFSPTLKKGVALALLNHQIKVGAEVSVDIRGNAEVFIVTKPPFVKPEVKGS